MWSAFYGNIIGYRVSHFIRGRRFYCEEIPGLAIS